MARLNRNQRRKLGHAKRVALFVQAWEREQAIARREIVKANLKSTVSVEDRAWSGIRSSVALVETSYPGRTKCRETLYNPNGEQLIR